LRYDQQGVCRPAGCFIKASFFIRKHRR
jgi:hypothetical protein